MNYKQCSKGTQQRQSERVESAAPNPSKTWLDTNWQISRKNTNLQWKSGHNIYLKATHRVSRETEREIDPGTVAIYSDTLWFHEEGKWSKWCWKKRRIKEAAPSNTNEHGDTNIITNKQLNNPMDWTRYFIPKTEKVRVHSTHCIPSHIPRDVNSRATVRDREYESVISGHRDVISSRFIAWIASIHIASGLIYLDKRLIRLLTNRTRFVV